MFYNVIGVYSLPENMGDIVSSVSMRMIVNQVSMIFLEIDFSFG